MTGYRYFFDIHQGVSGSADDSILLFNVVSCEENKLFLTHGDLAGLLPQMKMSFQAVAGHRCSMTLEYHSRNTELVERSEFVASLKEDLGKRSVSALSKLKSIAEK